MNHADDAVVMRLELFHCHMPLKGGYRTDTNSLVTTTISSLSREHLPRRARHGLSHHYDQSILWDAVVSLTVGLDTMRCEEEQSL